MALYGAHAEPSLVVTDPDDGDWFVDPDVEVSGSAREDVVDWLFDTDEFKDGTFKNVSLVNGRLVFNPVLQFEDAFDGRYLDTDIWEVVGGGTLSQRNGVLRIGGIDNTSYPLLVSRGDAFPEGVDWSTRVMMKFSDTGNYTRGFGWGMTANDTDPMESLVAIYSDRALSQWYHEYSVLVNGEWVADWYFDHLLFGLLEVKYTHGNDTYVVTYSGRTLSTISGAEKPVRFWLGCPLYEELDEWSRLVLTVDQIDVWTYTGSWISRVYDMGGTAALSRHGRSYSTSHTLDGRAWMECRASEDNVTWSDWGKFVTSTDTYEGRYLQFRINMSMEEVRWEDAYVRLSYFELEYHLLLDVVQVRLNGGDWMNATGTRSWDHMVTLVEDGNLLEVRVLDTAGNMNHTAMNLILDTTAPVGTVWMDVEGQYTNDRNITFKFNASDRYGIKAIRIALSEDYRDEEVVEPYVDTMVWTLPGGFVKTDVYIRFEDKHGLLSEPLHFFFFYDPLPPTGALHIQGGAPHTDETTVSIDLDYQDNEGITSVELSHDARFIDPVSITPGTHLYEGWELIPGGTGVRQVFMRVMDLAGNRVVVSDEIDLYVATAMGRVEPSGENVTSERLVQVAVFLPTEFEALWMQVSEDPSFEDAEWIDVNHYSTILLAEGDMERRVHVRFKECTSGSRTQGATSRCP